MQLQIRLYATALFFFFFRLILLCVCVRVCVCIHMQARSICRRAERAVVAAEALGPPSQGRGEGGGEGGAGAPCDPAASATAVTAAVYLNRLSDFLFVAARYRSSFLFFPPFFYYPCLTFLFLFVACSLTFARTPPRPSFFLLWCCVFLFLRCLYREG